MARLALERFAPTRAARRLRAAATTAATASSSPASSTAPASRSPSSRRKTSTKETRRPTWRRCATSDVRFIGAEELDAELEGADLVVDALLGTGFSGEVREKEAGIIEQINASAAAVLAVDVPSGVDGSTGEVAGRAVSRRPDGLRARGEGRVRDLPRPRARWRGRRRGHRHPARGGRGALPSLDRCGLAARPGTAHRGAGPQVLGRRPARRRGLRAA